MSANDPAGYVKRETDWLAVTLAEKKPFLDICLGAQLLHNRKSIQVRLSDRITGLGASSSMRS